MRATTTLGRGAALCLAALLVALLLVVGGPASPAHACGCEAPSLEEASADATLIARGTVEHVTESSDGYTTVRLHLESSWKGEPEYQRSSLGFPEGDCVPSGLDEGETVIVWATDVWNDHLEHPGCGFPEGSLEEKEEFLTGEFGEPTDLSHVPEYWERPTGAEPPEPDPWEVILSGALPAMAALFLLTGTGAVVAGAVGLLRRR